MSGRLLIGNVRGFYAALGIELPTSAAHDVSVRCFANPDAHAHGHCHPLVLGEPRQWRPAGLVTRAAAVMTRHSCADSHRTRRSTC